MLAVIRNSCHNSCRNDHDKGRYWQPNSEFTRAFFFFSFWICLFFPPFFSKVLLFLVVCIQTTVRCPLSRSFIYWCHTVLLFYFVIVTTVSADNLWWWFFRPILLLFLYGFSCRIIRWQTATISVMSSECALTCCGLLSLDYWNP